MKEEYAGHTITVSNDMTFTVAGPHVNNNYIDSARAAREMIDKAVANANKQARARLAITVISYNGEEQTVRGLHAGHGTVLGVKDLFFPNVKWVADLLKERMRLKARMAEIADAIAGYGISYRWHEASRDYEGAIARLQKEIADKTALAQAAENSKATP
jgi:hypothetical protein